MRRPPTASIAASADYVRARFHPLFQLRRVGLLRRALQRLDRPVWRRLDSIAWPVRVRAVSHGTYIATGGSPERVISELVRALVRSEPPQAFCDVGANFGYYGFLVKSQSPATQVILVEPEPDNLELIDATLRRTPVTAIDVRPIALSSSCGEGRFVRDRVSGATGSLEPVGGLAVRVWGADRDEIAVALSTLDDVAGECRLDLVKIDVEGHEEQVLAGAETVLRRDEPIILVECDHGDRRIEELLGRYGYELLDADRLEPVGPDTRNFLAWTPSRSEHVARACDAGRRVLSRP